MQECVFVPSAFLDCVEPIFLKIRNFWPALISVYHLVISEILRYFVNGRHPRFWNCKMFIYFSVFLTYSSEDLLSLPVFYIYFLSIIIIIIFSYFNSLRGVASLIFDPMFCGLASGQTRNYRRRGFISFFYLMSTYVLIYLSILPFLRLIFCAF